MAFAVTHIILTIVILDIFRHYVFGFKKFPRYLLIIGGIAGLAPDIDIPLSRLLTLLSGSTFDLHRVFTHSIIFVILFLLIGIVFQFWKKNPKWSKIFYVVSFGWILHLILDCFYVGPTYSIFWPFNFVSSFCPGWDWNPYASEIDAIILVIWFIHEEIAHKIKDYL